MPLPPTRLIIEPAPTPGERNMAVDETLLESALVRNICTVRIYQWSSPTVSLGYFQDADEFEHDPQWDGRAAVRRLSGGGAILHDREITYSISIPATQAVASQPSQLYSLVHNALIAVLAGHNITAHTRGAPHSALPTPHSPFLCFGRGDPNDIVLGAHKIVGSAQRRRRGAILQHGSILLERSPHAGEFPGISELTGVALDRAALSAEVGTAILALLGARAEPSELDDTEQQRAIALERERYSSLRWRKRD